MEITIGKRLSLLIAAIYIVVAYCFGGPEQALTISLTFLPFPLALIWFAEPLGDYTGFMGRGYVSRPTPAIFVSIIGWLILLGYPLLPYLARLLA